MSEKPKGVVIVVSTVQQGGNGNTPFLYYDPTKGRGEWYVKNGEEPRSIRELLEGVNGGLEKITVESRNNGKFSLGGEYLIRILPSNAAGEYAEKYAGALQEAGLMIVEAKYK